MKTKFAMCMLMFLMLISLFSVIVSAYPNSTSFYQEFTMNTNGSMPDYNGVHNGTFGGSPTYYNTGCKSGLGGCYGGFGNSVYIGTQTTPSGSYTACLWANITDSNTFEELFGLGGTSQSQVVIDSRGGTATLRITIETSGGYVQTDAHNVASFYDVWHFYCGVYDQSNHWLALIVDASTTQNVTTSGTWTASGDWQIGKTSGDSGQGFTGKVDEWVLYNRVLTADEISSLYNSGSGVQNMTWIIVDTTPPTITPPANVTTYLKSGSAVFTITDDTTVASSWINDTDNFDYNSTSKTLSWASLADGTYYVNVSANDTSDNNASAVWKLVILENTFPSSSNLVSYWGMNGNAHDEVSALNGQVTGCVVSDGISNASLSCSGAGNINMPVTSALGQTWTMSIWVYVNSSASQTQYLLDIFKQNAWTSYDIPDYGYINYQTAIKINPNYQAVIQPSNNQRMHADNSWTASLTPDSWNNIVLESYSGTESTGGCANRVSFTGTLYNAYVNGEKLAGTIIGASQEQNGVCHDQPTSITPTYWVVGAYHDRLSGNLQGKVDEYAYWTRKLNDTEITNIWNDGIGTFYPTQGSNVTYNDTQQQNETEINATLEGLMTELHEYFDFNTTNSNRILSIYGNKDGESHNCDSDSDGVYGYSFACDGTNGTYIGLGAGSYPQNFTISFWAKPRAIQSEPFIFSTQGLTSTYPTCPSCITFEHGYDSPIGSNNLWVDIFGVSDAGVLASGYTLNQWHHIAMTRNGDGDIYVWLDGVKYYKGTGSTQTSNRGLFTLGAKWGTWDFNDNSKFDEFGYWGRDLSDSEIQFLNENPSELPAYINSLPQNYTYPAFYLSPLSWTCNNDNEFCPSTDSTHAQCTCNATQVYSTIYGVAGDATNCTITTHMSRFSVDKTFTTQYDGDYDSLRTLFTGLTSGATYDVWLTYSCLIGNNQLSFTMTKANYTEQHGYQYMKFTKNMTVSEEAAAGQQQISDLWTSLLGDYNTSLVRLLLGFAVIIGFIVLGLWAFSAFHQQFNIVGLMIFAFIGFVVATLLQLLSVAILILLLVGGIIVIVLKATMFPDSNGG